MAKRRGLTLIELVVVMGVISFLVCVLMPSLLVAKQWSKATVCMSNAKQLSAAWTMFADDSDDRIVDAAPRLSGTITNTYPGTPYYGETNATFVADPQNESGNFRNDSLEDKIRGFERGGLWPYYENYRLMHCPSDERYLKPPAGGGGGTMGGYRSYSIGAVYSFAGFAAGSTGEDDYVTLKRDGIINPSEKFIWIEEADGMGYNQNTFNIWISFGDPPSNPTFWDPVAIWHHENSNFGYADGHASRYKWSDEYMIEHGVEGMKILTLTDIGDYEWFRDGYIPR